MRITIPFIEASVAFNRGKVRIGGGNVTSVHLVPVSGDLTGLSLNIYSSNDGHTVPDGKTALATLTSSTTMSNDVSADGIGWLIWECTSPANTAGCYVTLELEVKNVA